MLTNSEIVEKHNNPKTAKDDICPYCMESFAGYEFPNHWDAWYWGINDKGNIYHTKERLGSLFECPKCKELFKLS